MPLLDFALPGAVVAAFAMAATLPAYLLAIARLPFLAGRTAVQFLISVIATIIAWVLVLIVVPGARPTGSGETIVGILVLATAFLVYLEIWGLMSRGYTLSLILTLHRAGRPLSATELAQGYRGGEGLEWVMRHRVSGLQSAGLVRCQGPHLVLTPWLGRTVAWIYRVTIAVLGLKATG